MQKFPKIRTIVRNMAGNDHLDESSDEDAPEEERCNASIQIHRRGRTEKIVVEATESLPADIGIGERRLDLVPNEQALHNVLTSIREVAAAESTPMHKLIVQDPLTLPMTPEECDELVQLDATNQELERVVVRRTVSGTPGNVQFEFDWIG